VQSLNPDQLKILDKFVEEIHKNKMLSEIQKLMFNRAHFARFLGASDFDITRGLEAFGGYLQWRKTQSIDKLLVSSVENLLYIKASFDSL
jgi:hypothetical protein